MERYLNISTPCLLRAGNVAAIIFFKVQCTIWRAKNVKSLKVYIFASKALITEKKQVNGFSLLFQLEMIVLSQETKHQLNGNSRKLYVFG